MIIKERTSDSYVFTLNVASAADMQLLEAFRKSVAESNKTSELQKRVCARGRKPVTKEIIACRWTGKESLLAYNYHGNIVGGLKNATVLDVYVYGRFDR